MSLLRLATAVALTTLVLAGVAGADGVPLRGSVGPGFVIGLADGSGARVTQLDPGAFTLVVDDKSEEHDFHLQGPGGIDVSTTVEGVGTKTFSLNLVNGQYTFFCDPHAGTMSGSFTVGTPPATPPATQPPVKAPPAGTSAPTRLVLTLGASSVSLATPAGRPARSLASGPVVITVRDRSATRGVKLTGAGVSRSTTARFVGTVTWKVTLRSGSLVYGSDARTPVLRGGRATVS